MPKVIRNWLNSQNNTHWIMSAIYLNKSGSNQDRRTAHHTETLLCPYKIIVNPLCAKYCGTFGIFIFYNLRFHVIFRILSALLLKNSTICVRYVEQMRCYLQTEYNLHVSIA